MAVNILACYKMLMALDPGQIITELQQLRSRHRSYYWRQRHARRLEREDNSIKLMECARTNDFKRMRELIKTGGANVDYAEPRSLHTPLHEWLH